MDLTELTSFIESSPLKQQLLDLEFEFQNHNRPDLTKSFKGLTAIWSYAKLQEKGWIEIYQGTNPYLVQKRTTFQNTCNQILAYVQEVKSNTNINVQNRWHAIVGKHNGNFVPYEIAEISFLIELDLKYPDYFIGAYNYFFVGEKPIQEIAPNKNALNGALLALLYTNKDFLPLSSWTQAEINRINEVKLKYYEYLSEIEKQRFTLIDEFKSQQTDALKALESSKASNEISFTEWFEKNKKDFSSFTSTSTAEIKQIQDAYSELLKLKEPAEYWAKRAKELKDQGNKNLCWFITAVSITALSLFILLYISPDDMLESFFDNNKSRAIRWSIVFITFVSIMFIAIRTLGRMMFSSFHLARDAEERHQLTYIYLALKKDSAVEDKDRQLILQSLFSRADTGLLKDEAGPTMPGIEKVITKN